MENIGLLYYKDYFKSNTISESLIFKSKPTKEEEKKIVEHFSLKNNKLKKLTIGHAFEQIKVNTESSFKMKVVGSGLLIGTGNSHQTGSKGEYKLGLFFDHTTGLPIIPASSVKGILRSYFKEKKKRAFMMNIIQHSLKIEGIEDAFLHKLEKQLFDGMDLNDKPLGVYKRDTFFDSFPSGFNNQNLFDDDVITPHKHPNNPKLDPFTEPVPISFLKIKAGVEFNFKFKLHPFRYNGIEFSIENKINLFKELLSIGIGAKTNVGYGQLKPI